MSSANLTGRIKADLVTAMKAGEALRISVVRMLLSEMNYKQIDLGRELDDTDVVAVISREVKKRREAILSFKQADRPEQAATEAEELAILQAYMPEQMGAEEIKQELESIIASAKVQEFGAIMKVVSPQFKGRADGSVVAGLVKEMLGLK